MVASECVCVCVCCVYVCCVCVSVCVCVWCACACVSMCVFVNECVCVHMFLAVPSLLSVSNADDHKAGIIPNCIKQPHGLTGRKKGRTLLIGKK